MNTFLDIIDILAAVIGSAMLLALAAAPILLTHL